MVHVRAVPFIFGDICELVRISRHEGLNCRVYSGLVVGVKHTAFVMRNMNTLTVRHEIATYSIVLSACLAAWVSTPPNLGCIFSPSIECIWRHLSNGHVIVSTSPNLGRFNSQYLLNLVPVLHLQHDVRHVRHLVHQTREPDPSLLHPHLDHRRIQDQRQ